MERADAPATRTERLNSLCFQLLELVFQQLDPGFIQTLDFGVLLLVRRKKPGKTLASIHAKRNGGNTMTRRASHFEQPEVVFSLLCLLARVFLEMHTFTLCDLLDVLTAGCTEYGHMYKGYTIRNSFS
jgi:hypothetical protein